MFKQSKTVIVAVAAIALVATSVLFGRAESIEKVESFFLGSEVFAAAVAKVHKCEDACCTLKTGDTKGTVSAITGNSAFTASQSDPIACSLNDNEKIARRDEFRAKLASATQSVEEIEAGFVFTFASGHGADIVQFVELEGDCCSFFHFALDFEPKHGPVTLTISGPPGSKEILRPLLVSIVHPEN